MNVLQQRDYEFLKWVQTHRLVELDLFFYWVSLSTLLVSIVLLVFIGRVCLKRKSQVLHIRYYSVLVVFVMSTLLSQLLKYIVQRPRPFVAHPDIIQLYENSTFSFPSGHTIMAFTMAFSMPYLSIKHVYVIPVFCWAFLVAYSRMVLGAHYISDILSGIGMAYVFSLLIKPIATKWIEQKG